MIMNTLCALAIGFVLDALLGDTTVGRFLPGLIKKYITAVDSRIKNAYADSKEARNAAGGMFEFIVLLSAVIPSLGLYILGYLISNVTGILVESVLCAAALSIRNSRTLAAQIMRSLQKNDLESAREYFTELTGMNAQGLDSQDIVRCTLESASANITDHAVAPVFWIGLLGGVGGFVYRCVNTADRVGGRMGGYEDTSARVPTAINRFFTFVPSRIAAKLCVADGSLLLLDSKNASQTVKRFAADSANKNAAQTQAACAGLLDISIDSGYPNSVTMTLGKETQTPGTTSIYWVNQLISGSSVFMLLLVAALRVGLFFLMRYI